RGDAGLVRHGAERGQVTAVFDVPKSHPAAKILAQNGLDDTGEMIFRRVQLADGRTRDSKNDQAIGGQTLKPVGAALGEHHGGEESALASRRSAMMQGEKIASDLREAQEAVGGNHSPVSALSAAVRRLERRGVNSPALVEPAVRAIDIAINALEEADQHLQAALAATDFDPAGLERRE